MCVYIHKPKYIHQHAHAHYIYALSVHSHTLTHISNAHSLIQRCPSGLEDEWKFCQKQGQMHAYTNACMHARMNAHIHAHMRGNVIISGMHTHMHMHMIAYIHAFSCSPTSNIHTYMQRHRAHAHSQCHTRIQKNICTCLKILLLMHFHTHISDGNKGSCCDSAGHTYTRGADNRHASLHGINGLPGRLHAQYVAASITAVCY